MPADASKFASPDISEGASAAEFAARSAPGPRPGSRYAQLALLCTALVLAMTTWFSATAITPELIPLWHLSAGQAVWLTNMVQLGFVCGALLASLLNLADLVPLRRLMAGSGLLAALANLCLLWAPSLPLLLGARWLTGVALAGIYPPTLKLASTWFVRGRGLALGAVIAALSLGSALPHLLRYLTGHVDWRAVVVLASACTLTGAGLLLFFAAEGPYLFAKAVFDPRAIGAILRNRPLLLANLGYVGHMWELYAMWGSLLAFVSAAGPGLGWSGARVASLVSFAVIASGIAGALLGGLLADRASRTFAAGLMMALSGCCALGIGFAFHGPAWLFLAISVLWGVTVIGDSAQFSALVTELSDSSYVGTALALQLGLGFALTLVSIRGTALLASHIGWQWSLAPLAIGPALGVLAMLRLRRVMRAGA